MNDHTTLIPPEGKDEGYVDLNQAEKARTGKGRAQRIIGRVFGPQDAEAVALPVQEVTQTPYPTQEFIDNIAQSIDTEGSIRIVEFGGLLIDELSDETLADLNQNMLYGNIKGEDTRKGLGRGVGQSAEGVYPLNGYDGSEPILSIRSFDHSHLTVVQDNFEAVIKPPESERGIEIEFAMERDTVVNALAQRLAAASIGIGVNNLEGVDLDLIVEGRGNRKGYIEERESQDEAARIRGFEVPEYYAVQDPEIEENIEKLRKAVQPAIDERMQGFEGDIEEELVVRRQTQENLVNAIIHNYRHSKVLLDAMFEGVMHNEDFQVGDDLVPIADVIREDIETAIRERGDEYMSRTRLDHSISVVRDVFNLQPNDFARVFEYGYEVMQRMYADDDWVIMSVDNVDGDGQTQIVGQENNWLIPDGNHFIAPRDQLVQAYTDGQIEFLEGVPPHNILNAVVEGIVLTMARYKIEAGDNPGEIRFTRRDIHRL